MKITLKKLLFVLPLLAVGCTPKAESKVTVYDGTAQGSTYHIIIKSEDSVDLQAQIDSIIGAINRSMSIYDSTSLISRINRGETDSLDRYIFDCLTTAQRLSEETAGAYDITVKPLITAYGFGEQGATNDPNIDSLMQFVGYRKLSFDSTRIYRRNLNLQIDLNSIAQGYSVDVMAQMIEKQGYTDYLVEIGGEIFSRGTNRKGEPWVVGIDTPTEGNYIPGENLQAKLGLTGRGLATSGNYRKFYVDKSGKKIVHTVDALTGRPVIHSLLSATVVAENTKLADAYGTVMMIVGLERAKEFIKAHPEIDAYLVYSDSEGKFQTFITEKLKKCIIK